MKNYTNRLLIASSLLLLVLALTMCSPGDSQPVPASSAQSTTMATPASPLALVQVATNRAAYEASVRQFRQRDLKPDNGGPSIATAPNPPFDKGQCVDYIDPSGVPYWALVADVPNTELGPELTPIVFSSKYGIQNDWLTYDQSCQTPHSYCENTTRCPLGVTFGTLDDAISTLQVQLATTQAAITAMQAQITNAESNFAAIETTFNDFAANHVHVSGLVGTDTSTPNQPSLLDLLGL